MFKILAVDDNKEALASLKNILSYDYEVITASDGKEAVDIALTEEPDLILMDVIMPVMNGIQAMRAIKDDHRMTGTPIIIVTGCSDKQDMINGLEAGADDYVEKPFDPMALLARIAAHLRTKALYDENKELARELEKKNRELERSNARFSELDKLKTTFMAMAAHELKNPLNIINCYLNMLLEETINTRQTEILTSSLEGVECLAHIVEEMLDISTIDSGKVVLDIQEHDMVEVTNQVLSLMRGEFERKDIKIVNPTGICPASFDFKRIRQVLINLLKNSIKFTQTNGAVSVSVKADSDNLTVTVSDTGEGISEMDIDKVFDEFYRCMRDEEGSGLGLSICKKIVELHGGRIWVESIKDSGSTFYFTLPQKRPNVLVV